MVWLWAGHNKEAREEKELEFQRIRELGPGEEVRTAPDGGEDGTRIGSVELDQQTSEQGEEAGNPIVVAGGGVSVNDGYGVQWTGDVEDVRVSRKGDDSTGLIQAGKAGKKSYIIGKEL